MTAEQNSRWHQPESRSIAAIAAISFLAISAALLSGCESSNAAAAARLAMGPMPVSVVRVAEANVPLTGSWVGTLDGYVNAQIQPQVSGYLVKQNYREGSSVSKGEVLFRIDPRPFQAVVDQAQAQVEQARGQLAQAQAQLALARINVKRDTPLAQVRAIAQSQLDTETQQEAQAEASVAAGEASVSAAQAALQTAQLNLGFTEVRSLIDGVAGQATTQVGNLVNPQSVLTAVSQLDPIKVYFSISDSEYLALVERARQSGGDLLRAGSKLPLTLTLSNGEPYSYKGHIVFVDRQMNQQTGAIRIAAAFPNPGNILRPGQFGRVTAETELRRNALLVPQIAVEELQGIEQIYTVTSGNRVHVVNVKLGPQYGNDWIVESGLEPGARVITDNLQKLREGAPVAPHAAQLPPANNPVAGS
ncbi:MAG TPA: efflux RND transporter periplasmic adaptor subunit [Acidobacteriaceae bacterium]|jgi:membrane fusion protein (multidrug efflux system)|nr:efflux RND transporter periplasmic adaptor subunit [Acidobacteriaceae bacterium]